VVIRLARRSDWLPAASEAFEAGAGRSHGGQLCEDRLVLAGQHGIPVEDERGGLLPCVDDAVTRTVTAAIWFGTATGYLTLAGRFHAPPAGSWKCRAGSER
jgi:hypothetical protein